MVRGADGALLIGRHLPGRGAWLCVGSPTCVELAARRKAFGRALRAEIAPEAVAALRVNLADRARMRG